MWKIFIVVTLFILLTIHQIDSIKISCKFDQKDTPNGKIKECKAEKVSSTDSDTKLSEVEWSEDLNEFEALSIFGSPNCYYLPKGITTHFINLKVLSIARTGLKSITKEDLKPFENLNGLYIGYSELTSLDNDLFGYNSKLERLSIYGSKIHSVETGIFKPLQKLTWFFFGNCICIKGELVGDARKTVQAHLKEVETKCQNNRAVEAKESQQGNNEASKDSTTERQGFLA